MGLAREQQEVLHKEQGKWGSHGLEPEAVWLGKLELHPVFSNCGSLRNSTASK